MEKMPHNSRIQYIHEKTVGMEITVRANHEKGKRTAIVQEYHSMFAVYIIRT